MSVSGIFSNMGNSASAISYQLQKSTFQQLGQDLMSGNLSAAQSDFATLQQAFAQPAAISSSSTSNPVSQAFQQLATDLKSGNLSAAQKDYSTIQQDLQSSGRHLHNHHRMRISSGPEQNTLLQDLNQLGQTSSSTSSPSASPVDAQQAYATLQAVGVGVEAAGTNTVGQYLLTPPVQDLSISFLA